MSIAELIAKYGGDVVAAQHTKQAYAGVICRYLGELIEEYRAGTLASGQGVCGNIGDKLDQWSRDNDVEMDSENPYSSPYNMWYAFKGEPMRTWPKSTGNRYYPVPHPDHMDNDEREWDEDGEPPYHATWSEWAYENCNDHFDGEYGALRIELAEYTLKYFERMRDGE
ncbi:hypothetical protein CPT_Ptah_007 [Stenotrophomonas phage Ptah]|uniref:Uncharacterized protein n=1 Tax=Stenotrophomonas phage Ptah TaxID=2859657 RepID=A0AAE8BI00_9CAUD|nr:hypothetical protein CPT_Ptah_007 [Stenotrophomonas phage Ptah]